MYDINFKKITWKKSVNTEFFSQRIWKFEVIEYLLVLLIISYTIIFYHYDIQKYYSFRCGAWDFGILVQSISSSIKGKLFTNNVELYYSPTGSYFGVHFSPIFFLIVPFFYLIPKVETIILLKSLILALGSIPVYLIAKH
jgi:uncharacterized membrane protein